jgi:hypothetical protein
VDELSAMDRQDPRVLSRGSANELAIGDGRLFEDTINQTREATFIMLLAVFFFGAYWLLAGPGGYWALKLKGLKHHAWIAFAATAALFTAIAWGGVRVMRAQNLELRHVTFLDHVARPPADERLEEPLYQRAVSWASLSVPRYGTARLAIESAPRQRDMLLTWWAPEKPPDRFPNVDRYMVDVGRAPSVQTIPVRATATQLALYWLGALDPDWGGMLRASPEDPIRVEHDPRTGQPYLAGTLRHDLPGPLTSVRLIWITGDRNPPPRYEVDESGIELPWTPVPLDRGRPMLNDGHMWSLGDAWHADSDWSLAVLDPPSRATALDRAIYARYVSGNEGDGWSPTNTSLGHREVVEYIEMLSLYHHLTPPKYHRVKGKGDPETMVAQRRLGRELDLSPWLSRPCLIVIGYLHGSPTPIPLTVDGERPAGEGLTVVRWIYPLPVDEDELRRP